MADIPDRFIREKTINHENEILSCLGKGLTSFNKEIKPFSIGVLSLLEILDNKLLKGDKQANWFDFGVIFYINDKRQNAVSDVAEYSRGYKEGLERKVEQYIKSEKLSLLQMNAIEEVVNLSFSGFDMLPKDSGNSKYLFGSETIANIAYICCSKLNKTYDEVVWDTPLTLIGHIVAVNAQANGLKGVGRRKDEEHIKAIFKKCKEWDEKNMIYPWQYLEPQFYPLLSYQNSKEQKRTHARRLKEVTCRA